MRWTRAQQLPLPDELNGGSCGTRGHQIGHALGFPHNLKASSTYTAGAGPRSEVGEENGYVASIMDDARYNYVAQPEDNLDPAT